jgi:hypothetical protein
VDIGYRDESAYQFRRGNIEGPRELLHPVAGGCIPRNSRIYREYQLLYGEYHVPAGCDGPDRRFAFRNSLFSKIQAIPSCKGNASCPLEQHLFNSLDYLYALGVFSNELPLDKLREI